MGAAAVILAGGRSSRFRGNKALVEIASERLIDRVINKLKDFFAPLILVTNTPEEYQGLAVEIIRDLIPGKGPLSGIHAGLLASPHSLNFVVGCDMPFISGELGVYLAGQAVPDDDVVVPLVHGYAEPLSAVYRKTCIPCVEALLLTDQPKTAAFADFYDQVRVKYVQDEELSAFGDGGCFFNINTRDDLKKALENFLKQ